MAKNVKGALFLDYVRMVKKRPQVDWSKHLAQADLEMLKQMILPSQWYPLESYQRFGVAVFHELAKGDVEVVRAWGRQSMTELYKVYQNLVDKDDPVKSLEKFQLLRGRFFDFEGVVVIPQGRNRVQIKLELAFEQVADAAYAWQMLGAFEQLLELSGARNLKHSFLRKSWEGAADTMLELNWE